MSGVDTRVVQMKFDNAQFQQGVAQTLKSLETLNKGLQLQGATKGLNDLGAATKNIDLGHLSSAVDSIRSKFSALGIAGVTAISNITNRVVNAGLQLAKSLTIDPVSSGLREYETNLNSIQTILANTAHEGTNLKQVNAALAELNHYSDQTIYNFSEMARNIGTFTAAGVSLKTSTEAIKGIANLAAISGSNAEQASAAMYQLSQALAAGRVTLEDWNSVVNAGMGGKVFQDALMETARVHGVAIDQMVKDEGSFRLTLQKGWLTSDILTETLSKFTGDLNAKQLKSMGYSKQQIAEIIKLGKTAKAAATEVKTASQLIDTLQESVGSGWAQTWQLIFGDFEEAKSLWTGVNNVLGDFISSSSDARNKVLGDWKELGGRTALIDAVKNAFQALISVVKPIKDAFRQIFPATTGKQLYEMTVAIRDFMANLKIGGETADRLKRTFAGVFAVFGIGWDIVKGLASVLLRLFGVVTNGSGGFLELTAKIGDFLVSIRDAIHNGDGLGKVFQKLGDILLIPINLLKGFSSLLNSAFNGFDGAGASIGSFFEGIWNTVEPIIDKITTFFANVGKLIGNALKGVTWGDILSTINTGLLAGLALGIGKMIKTVIDKLKGEGGGGGFFDGIKDAFEQLTDTLSAMQNTLRAATLLQLAGAIGVLTLSVVALSKIDAGGLTRALTAMTVMFTQLGTSLYIFEKFLKVSDIGKMFAIAAAMSILGVAIRILTSSVKALADLEWEGLAKGLLGVSVMIGALTASVRLMPNDKKLISTGIGLVAIAGAIKLLSSAVTDLSGLSWDEMARGIVGVGALLGGLTLFTRLAKIDKTGVITGAGLLIMAASIKVLASAMNDIAKLSWENLGKGLAGLAVGLTLIVAAMKLADGDAFGGAAILLASLGLKTIAEQLQALGKMKWDEILRGLTAMLGAMAIMSAALTIIPPTAVLGAAALLIAANSLGMVADALQKMGEMSWEEIGKSMVALFGSLLLISAAMIAMETALPGAAALLVVSAALTVLTPVLQAMGSMSWEAIGKGLLLLAGAFIVIAAGGMLLIPALPGLLGLAVAAGLLGVAALAAGAGVAAFAAGLATLAAVGAAGKDAIVGIVSGLIGLIPQVMAEIGKGIIAFAGVIAQSGPAITNAITTVLSSLLSAMRRLTPQIVNTLLSMLNSLLSALARYVPQMVNSGLRLVTGILNGIAKNIGQLVTAGVNVVTKFISGVSSNLGRIIQSGVDLILKFVNGVATAIRSNSAAMGAAGANLASSIIEGMVRGLAGGVGRLASQAASMAQSALSAAKHALGINSPSKEFIKVGKSVNEGFYKGLVSGDKDKVVNEFNNLKSLLKDTVAATKEDVKQATDRLKKLTSARKKDTKAIKEAQKNLAQARLEYKNTSAAYSYLTKNLTDERNKLQVLSTDYAKVGEKLKAANDQLKDAIKTRDDYNKSLKDQYSDLPDITGETKLTDYVDELKKQIADTKIFAVAIQKLRDLGLNDKIYKELLTKGTAALPFISQILDGGKASVDELNKLGNDLDSVAGGIGTTASKELYQAAVDAAAGLVKGLEDQQAAIKKQIDKIADYMVTRMNQKLGIKSPSRVFAQIGEFSAKGLAKGLEDSSKVIGKSAEIVGNHAISSLRTSLSGLASVINTDMDMTPTITPVLDLTNVQKNAGQIGSLLSTKPLSVGTTYSRARSISAEQLSNQALLAEQLFANQAGSVVYNQYNSSPKALSAAEIYRQTKNQLSVVKGALGNNA